MLRNEGGFHGRLIDHAIPAAAGLVAYL